MIEDKYIPSGFERKEDSATNYESYEVVLPELRDGVETNNMYEVSIFEHEVDGDRRFGASFYDPYTNQTLNEVADLPTRTDAAIFALGLMQLYGIDGME